MTKTRGIAFVVFLMMLLSQIPGFAEDGLVKVEIEIVDKQVQLNQKSYDNERLEYPVLKYNDVIYLPLAWNTLEALGLRYTAAEDVVTLSKFAPETNATANLDVRSSAFKKNKGTAEISGMSVKLGDQALKIGKFPMIKFGNVNYIPFTWEVRQQLELHYSTDRSKAIHINTKSSEALNLQIEKADNAYVQKLAKAIRNVNANKSAKESVALAEIILKECGRYDIDETWVMAMIWKESRFNEKASYRGAYGIMQILASTGKNYGLSKDELLDPVHSIRTGVSYLKSGFEQFKSMELAVLAYNQGSTRVERGTYKTGYLDDVKEKREKIIDWLK